MVPSQSHKHIALTTNFRRQIRRITLYDLRFLLDQLELKHHQSWVGHRPSSLLRGNLARSQIMKPHFC